MQMSAACMACLLNKQMRDIAEYPDETKKAAYIQAVMKAISEADKDVSAPYMTKMINGIHERFFGFAEDLSKEKSRHNQMMLRIAGEIEKAIEASPDPIETALRYARAGNYIDMAALTEVKDEKVKELLDKAKEEKIDPAQYRLFIDALQKAKRFLYITDNAGEIVMDMLLMRQIQKAYPLLRITALVRGKLTSNDATMEDAREIGLDREFTVIGNGTDIAGTETQHMPREVNELLSGADVILSKGQGNFETLLGCGLPVFYIFLCKCDWFVRRFALPRFSGVFIREQDVRITKYLVGDERP